MADNEKSAAAGGNTANSMGRFTQFGASLRQSAQELSQKAAAQVNEINTKAKAAAADAASVSTKASTTPTSSAGATAGPSMSQLRSDSVSKEDLLEILNKMNKKVKALSTLRQQLSERAEIAEAEKARLASLVKDEILNGAVNVQDGQDEILQYQAAWRTQDEEKSMALQQLQTEFQVVRAQQQQENNGSNGGGGGDGDAGSSSWETEKKALMDKYKLGVAKLKETLQKQHAQELAEVKAQSGSAGGNTGEEVQKIKMAAAAQLQAFKKKVATARTAELTKVKTESAAAAKVEFEEKLTEQTTQHESQLSTLREELEAKARAKLEQEHGSKDEGLLEELETKHAAKIERLKVEATTARANEVENARQEAEQTVTTEMEEKLQEHLGSLRQAHKEEIEKLRAESTQQLSEASSSASAMLESSKTAEATVNAAKDELEQLKQSHAAELETLKSELESSVARVEEEKQALQSNTAGLKEFAAKKEAEIARLREESEAALKSEQERLVAEFQGEKASLQAEMEKSEKLRAESTQQLSEASSSASAMLESSKTAEATVNAAKDELEQLKQSHAAELETLKSELESSVARVEEEKQALESNTAGLKEFAAEKEAEIARLLEESEATLKSEQERLVAEFQGEKASLQAATDKKLGEMSRQSQDSEADRLAAALKEARQEHEATIQQERQAIEETKQTELDKVREEASAALSRAVNETEERGSSEAKGIRESLESQIQTLEVQSKQFNDDIRQAKQTESTLQGELEQLHAKLAAAADEKAAVLAQAADGELSAHQMINDALSKQKESYEAMLENQQSRYIQEQETVKTTVDEVSQARDSALADGSALRQELETLQASSRSGNEAATEAAALVQKQLAERDAQATAKEDKYQSELAAVNDELGNLRTEHDTLTAERQRLEADLLKAKETVDGSETEKTMKIADLEQRLESDSLKLEGAVKAVEQTKAELEQNRSTNGEKLNVLQADYDASQKAIEEVNESHGKAMEELRSSLQSESTADTETRIADVRKEVLTQSEADMERVKLEYQEQLTESNKKESALTEAFNKVKAVYGAKMKKLEAEHSEKIGELEKKNVSLEESVTEASEKMANGVEHSDRQVAELRDSLSKREEALTKEKTELAEQLQRSEQVTKALEQEQSMKITGLEQELVDAQRHAAEAKEEVSTGAEEELSARLKSIDEEHAAAFQRLEADHAAALETVQEQAGSMRATAEAEVSSRFEKEKTELAEQLDAQTQRYAEEKQEQRKAMEAHVDQMTANFKTKLKTVQDKAAAEITRLQEEGKENASKLSAVIERLKAITASTTSLRNENEGLKAKLKTEGSTQRELRTQLDSAKQEMGETVANSSATASSLLEEQEKLETERSNMQKQMEQLKRGFEARGTKLEESNGKLEALTSNLNAMAKERKEQAGKLSLAEKKASKLSDTESEVSSLREQINTLKLDLTKSTSTMSRLQAEKEAGERSHGQRTALVGMLETQLSAMNDKNADTNAKLEASLYDLSQKDEAIQGNEEQVRILQGDVVKAKNATQRANESLGAAQKGADAKTGKLVESLQRELHALKQQMAKKSSAAQRLLQERETECGDLRSTNKSLQQEVDKGSLSDRRIFELAAKQSNRESHQVSEIDIRDKIIDSMKETLLSRDGDLATAENQVQAVEGQVEELCRVRRREDVNLDYLKSIVVQYLSLPSGSSERARLLPVLATLLQFDSSDYRTIEDGKNKISWWGSIAPTVIGASATTASTQPSSTAAASIAEVSVTSTDQTPPGKARTTSLQF